MVRLLLEAILIIVLAVAVITAWQQKRKNRTLKEKQETLEIQASARAKELEEVAEYLENKAQAKNKELHERINELEKFHRLTVGRELKMIELKKELARLKKQSKGRQ